MTEEMKSRIDRFLRVDHAGELGAKRIYQGQLAVLKNHPVAPEIEHMKEQEQHHLDTFENLINEYQTRPSVLTPLWNGAGFMLGAVTAAMGPKAAMACTAAVEAEIDAHYAAQLDELETISDEEDLTAAITKFRADEAGHRQTALDAGAEDAPGYDVMSRIIRLGCKAAIRVSERF